MPPSLFERYADRDVVDLIAAYPLAWVATAGSDPAEASLLPLLAETDATGRLGSLLGHMARTNPLVAALRSRPAGRILFTGPQGYISPALVSDRSWAPTWNFAQIRISAEISFEESGADQAIGALVDAMEHAAERPWTTAEMGARYPGMARAIIAFRARVTACEARFKLGQDERPEILAQILRNRPDDDLSRWMLRFNRDRLGAG